MKYYLGWLNLILDIFCAFGVAVILNTVFMKHFSAEYLVLMSNVWFHIAFFALSTLVSGHVGYGYYRYLRIRS